LQNYAQDKQKAIKKAGFLIEQHQQQTHIPGIQVAVFVDDFFCITHFSTA
jgi:hypothetical protein